MKNKLTIKQRNFVKKYIESNGNGTRAALDAYNTKDATVAHSIASENLQKPAIQRAIELALERVGLSDDYISELLKNATEAGLGNKATNADTLRGVDMLLRLKGAFPTPIQKTAHMRIELHQQMINKSNDELIRDLQKLQEDAKNLISESATKDTSPIPLS